MHDRLKAMGYTNAYHNQENVQTCKLMNENAETPLKLSNNNTLSRLNCAGLYTHALQAKITLHYLFSVDELYHNSDKPSWYAFDTHKRPIDWRLVSQQNVFK